MNAEQLKKDISMAIELAESIHDDMVEKFASDSVPSEVMVRTLEIAGQITTLKWYLEHISEGVLA